MKKRKVYEISVIDKTYSKIISDETKFYTSDTALELGFELKEADYIFESAEIVLLNIDDRSLVTREVSKFEDGFAYELDDDIIAHYGEWRGQLRFEAGETYVSSPVKFRIENDLSNDRPPQLSDVQSWVSLKRYADSLVDELKQAVLDVEGMDDTFNANELERQDKFEMAEQSRQTTFETNESERDETFESNELTRQTQELEREEAEATRQTVFEDNESSRTETFNANESTRQENESVRQEAEGQRQLTFETNETERQTAFETSEQERKSAELTRVENEEQRKIDHANRSAELDGKADKVVIENLIENGNFSDGTTGWQSLRIIEGSFTTLNNEASFTPSAQLGKISQGENSVGDTFYISADVYTTSSKVRLFSWSGGSSYHSGSSKYEKLSMSLTPTLTSSTALFAVEDIRTSGWDEIRVKNAMALNLTQTFGAGNEPTKEEMDELIKVTGYINGEYALNNKEMLIWTLALIRRNKNAIVALGGA